MTTVSPQGHLLYPFFRDPQSGALPSRVAIDTTDPCPLRCHESLGRDGPDHLP